MSHPSDQIKPLKSLLESCALCPRRCRVNRLRGETGFCLVSDRAVVHSVLPHHGEEPPLSGENGAGTIFLSSCNLRCSYCQNRQISHFLSGEAVDADELASMMLGLAGLKCHNIEPVTPTPHLPFLIEALALAAEKGLALPFVYNCGGYESPEVIRLLDGIVDIYLPDFKYGNGEDAFAFSGIRDYPEFASASLREMVRQCGDELVMERGVAKRGIIVRHLVLPGRIENSREVLRSIKREGSTAVPLSIMSQYTPTAAVRNHPLLGRRISRDEYEAVVEYALDLGFTTLFTQEVDDRDLVPDFDREEPFQFEK